MIQIAELVQLGTATLLGLVGLARGAKRLGHGIRSLSVNSKGVIAIEAAVLCPVFLIFAVGIFDIGAFMVQENGVQIGILAAERFISTQDDVVHCNDVVQQSTPLLTHATIVCNQQGNNVALSVSVPYIGVQMFGFAGNVTGSALIPLHSSTAGNSAKKAGYHRWYA